MEALRRRAAVRLGGRNKTTAVRNVHRDSGRRCTVAGRSHCSGMSIAALVSELVVESCRMVAYTALCLDLSVCLIKQVPEFGPNYHQDTSGSHPSLTCSSSQWQSVVRLSEVLVAAGMGRCRRVAQGEECRGREGSLEPATLQPHINR